MPAELSAYAINAEATLLEALQQLDGGDPRQECPAELVEALEGVARTFPFAQAAREAFQTLDGVVAHAWQFLEDELTLRGLAWVLPTARQPFVISVGLDADRTVVKHVEVSLGELGREPSAPYTSREIRYLEDALRNDVTSLTWAHRATWSRH